MYSKRNEKYWAKRQSALDPSRESFLTFSLGFDKKIFAQMTSVIILSILISSIIIQIPVPSKADPNTPQDLGNGISRTTWTFDNKDDYNTTDTVIKNGKVGLTINNFTWNQRSKYDFNQAIKNNVTVTEQFDPNIIWSHHLDDVDPGPWTDGIIGGSVKHWQYGLASDIPQFIGAYDSGSYVWGTKLNGEYVESGGPSDTFLKSENIDLSASEKTEMSFWHYYIFDNATDINDAGIVEVSTDNGGSWEKISPTGAGYDGPIDDPDNPLYTSFPQTWSFGGNSSAWVQARFDLSKYDGEDNFTFRFRFTTNGHDSDYGWYIDDIQISSTPIPKVEVALSPGNLDIGNEAKNEVQRPANVTLIDTNNPASQTGILTEWTVHVENVSSNDSKGVMRIYRRVGDTFVLIDETANETLTNGKNVFNCNIAVEAGDYIGWFSENAEIFGKQGGDSYFMPGYVTENHNVPDWSFTNYTFAIRATGRTVIPFGILTSEIFNGGSTIIWDEIRWSEDSSLPGTDIVVQAQSGGPINVVDIAWNDWTEPLSDPTGSELNIPDGQYFRYMVTFSTDIQPNTPILKNVTVSYRKYSFTGEVETEDFVPAGVVQWLEFSKSEILIGQTIDYYYSIDSGSTWVMVPQTGGLDGVSVLEGKIRFKMILETEDSTVTPLINDISLTYSNARPLMSVYIDTESDSAHPTEELSIKLFYHNKGIGNATEVDITLFLDEYLIHISDGGPSSPLIEEKGKAIKWKFGTEEITTGNRSFTIKLKVKNLDRDATLSCFAALNYTDVGGNYYPGVQSNTLIISVTPQMNILLIIILIATVSAILIAVIVIVVKKRRESEEAKKISLDSVERGIGYLVIEDNPTKSYCLFSDLIDYGYSGLCITRTFPGRVKSTYSFEDVSILWLSRAKDEDSILPSNLGAVLRSVKDFMEESERSVILLDGLEYLIVHNDFPKVLKLVHLLNEMSAINDAVLIIPLNPITLDEGKVALLKRDLKILT